MTKKIALIGHCGPDSTYLRMVIGKAVPGTQILAADDDKELGAVLGQGADLLLFNRELGYGFDQPMGADLIGQLHKSNPKIKTMLVSNFPDAQAQAVANGALPGFGKREIGSPRVVDLLRRAVGDDDAV